MPLTKEEKIKRLNDRLKKTKQQLSIIQKKQTAKNRKERTRMLIQVAAFFFKDQYQNAYKLISENPQKANELAQKIGNAIKE